MGEMVVLRSLLGEALRERRLRQHRTLREVSGAARVSLGYLSEVERGQKEASSELLASICRALGVRLSDVLSRCASTPPSVPWAASPAPWPLSPAPPELLTVLPSDEPVREPGTRSRSGNAMGRTRAALLQATAECIARYGVKKTTMVDVASRSRVAKATLYNHFRTKDDVLAALVEQQVTELVAAAVAVAASEGLSAALAAAARRIAEHPALRTAAGSEQALLSPLLTPGSGRGWQVARDGVAAVLVAGRAAAGPEQVELVLRWCTSQVLWPLTPERAEAAGEALDRALHPEGAGSVPAPAEAAAIPRPPAQVDRRSGSAAGLGWPA
jgi:AcrR family transcriptional regulator/transcriptional regulator with XRE-family HTH domain